MPHKVELLYDLVDLTLAKKAMNAANDGITIVDMRFPEQPLIFINKAFEKMTGYKKSEVLGRNCRFLQGNLYKQPELATIHHALKNGKNCRVVLKNMRKDGSLLWNELSLAPITDSNNKLSYYVGIQKDVTDDILQKQQIAYLSEHDDLTNLYNFRGFFTKINELIVKAKKENFMIAIGIADIDSFKEINDYYGHLKGNTILKLIGSEFLKEFRADDIAARFGGDEFSFAMLVNDEHGDFFYDKVARVIYATNVVLSDSLPISMSVGIAIEKEPEATNIERLLHLADNIMYKNKQLVHLHDKNINKSAG